MEERNIRNVAILGHMGSGKTTLVETIYRMNNPEAQKDKTSISDFTPEEVLRKSSIKSAIIPVDNEGVRINLIDCPGNDDFVHEAIATISVVKGAILVVDAQKGVEVETQKHWNMLRKKGSPT